MPKKAKVRMYSRKSVNVPIRSEEEISIKSMFDLFLNEKSIEGLSERTINDYIIHSNYLMDFFEEEIVNTQFNKEIFKD